MTWERELIGYYATDHPLARHENLLKRLAGVTTAGLAALDDRQQVRLGGMIRSPRTSIVRKGVNEGRRMAFFQLEDFSGHVECVVFSRAYGELESLITPDRVVFAEGKVDLSRDEPSFQVDRIVPVEDAPRVLAQGVLVRLHDAGSEALDNLKATVAEQPGELAIVLEFLADHETLARVKAGPSWRVAAGEDLLDRLAALPAVERAEYLVREP